MTTILIKNGHVIDPANGVNDPCDILVVDGVIKKVSQGITDPADEVIDASGLTVTPGLVDIQVHFREPGREDKETLESGSRAALAGGVTSVVTMPNTDPVSDDQSVIAHIVKRAREIDLINIYPTGSITKGQKGSSLTQMNDLKQAGAIAVSDDGVDVQDEEVLRRAMEYARTIDMLVMSHCETESLTNGGVMHEGWVSTQLGLPGIPAMSEDMGVRKNIMLAQMTGARLHLLHNSTKGAMQAIREARAAGATNITAEVSVQHFALTDEACLGYNTNAKMYPPLRSQDHVDAVIEAIKDGVIDAFTTDHAPHTLADKQCAFEDAAFGFIGLETSFAVVNKYLIKPGHVTLSDAIEKMTTGPAKIVGIPAGTLSVGARADISLFDMTRKWTYKTGQGTFSKGMNSPFDGHDFEGRCVMALVNGRVKYKL